MTRTASRSLLVSFRGAHLRKSYEFEDLLQSSSENSRVDWYAQTKLGLTRTLSEENVYEDILDPPMKENPYEDIELHGRCLGKKCVLTFPGSPTSSIPDTSAKGVTALRTVTNTCPGLLCSEQATPPSYQKMKAEWPFLSLLDRANLEPVLPQQPN
ncbi:hypothetical protein U0070_016364 [Myodes glareolus]|uniref:Uncharacterized protein n=1 Tax=Myodes glareolus TaxID=447135 RepID=A0AAW0H278_MYOGA